MSYRRSLALLGVVMSGVAACSAATPTPPAATQGVVATPTSAPTSPPAAPTGGEGTGTLSELGQMLEIQAVDGVFTSRVLEFASTGFDIVASAAAGAGDASAPDLYRIPAATGKPELIWRNPERDHSLVKLVADDDTIAFVDMPIAGEAEWTLRLIPEEGDEPVILDTLAADSGAPSLVPSVAVYWPYVAWTAFDRGSNGPVSQLLVAEAPEWKPRVLVERPADEAEVWFPSLLGGQLVFTELVYADDRQSDERRVWLTGVHDPDEPRRLDTSGLATMPVINQHGIAWKESQAGFHQLNWGTMERFDPGTGRPAPMWAEDEVNYPSAGTRFMTWWTVDPTHLIAWDGLRGEGRRIVAYDSLEQRIRRPHVAGSLIVWHFEDESVDPPIAEIRYALLP